ncbi:MAG: molybdopterin-guanine dinucleotide biosynthesis protein B [Pseudomonadota bacterium]
MHRPFPSPTPPLVGIVGRSGSGKTTLLEFLVEKLSAQGKRVNIIKHSHHDLELEPAHKDSARLRAAGAAEVMVASPFRYAIMHELRGAPEPGLEEQLARLGPADVTLVEGFKAYSITKLEVFRPSLGHLAQYLVDPHIAAVASDQPAPADLGTYPVWLDLNTPHTVLAWLTCHLAQVALAERSEKIS